MIEGVELSVCPACSKFGKVIAPVHRPSPKEQHRHFQRMQPQEKEEKIQLLVEGYPDIIKKRREAIGLSQKEFAGRVNEKESLIHKIESGNFEPELALAKKLEKAFGVKLVEEHEEKHESFKDRKSVV